MNFIKLCFVFFLSLCTVTASDQYFQQYVRYDIDTRLNIETNALLVTEKLLYTNHSPDTLSVLYFHLYLNKYRAGSLVYPDLEEDRGGITINSCSENGRQNLNFTIDHTLMKLELDHPIPPGYSCRFEFDFVARLPDASTRYGYQGLHYDVGNWYLTPVVYDREGWHLHQHLKNEFYQEWGDFSVRILIPDDFIVGATGNLVNTPNIQNRSGKVYRAGPTDTTLAVWHFEAKNVHDFAWTADPSYIRLQSYWNGITLNILVMDYNQDSWNDVGEWALQALQYLHDTFGPYPYDQLTIADTYIRAGGIEYPQIVFINDFINPEFEPGNFRAVVIHEMAHNWFYGLLANNQLEDEWLDEGFTSFAEIKAMEAVFGRNGNMNPGNRGWFLNYFGYNNDNRLDQMTDYLIMAKSELNEDPIDLHADYLREFSYQLQYAKMACVLFMLEYTLGDSLFYAAMRNYYWKWRFKHPAPADFIRIMEQISERELGWFFEQWLRTNRTLDYAVDGYSGQWQGNEFIADIRLSRLQEIFMPLDLDITLQDGSVRKYQIPVDQFSKPDKQRKVLPYWHFNQTTYMTTLRLPQEIRYIEIDPSLRLADINRMNNISGFLPPQKLYFMRSQHVAPPLNAYLWELWPDLLYNDVDKLLAGFRFDGSYLNTDHKMQCIFWLKPHTKLLDFDIRYNHPVNWMGSRNRIHTRLFTLDGRQGGEIGLSKGISTTGGFHVYNLKLAHHLLFNSKYLMAPWSDGANTYLDAEWYFRQRRQYSWDTQYTLRLKVINSVFSGDRHYSRISVELNRFFSYPASDWYARIRLYGGIGDGHLPDHFRFNLAGANSYEEFGDPFYRSRGSLHYPWRREGHLYRAGGGNVRGYSLVGNAVFPIARNILAGNIDIELPNPFYLPFVSDITPSVFFDYGANWNFSFPRLEEFRASTGFGLSWDAFDIFDYVFNLTEIHFDFPLWLNHPGKNNKRLKFRWLIRFEFN